MPNNTRIFGEGIFYLKTNAYKITFFGDVPDVHELQEVTWDKPHTTTPLFDSEEGIQHIMSAQPGGEIYAVKFDGKWIHVKEFVYVPNNTQYIDVELVMQDGVCYNWYACVLGVHLNAQLLGGTKEIAMEHAKRIIGKFCPDHVVAFKEVRG
jgi:hypothetical protein